MDVETINNIKQRIAEKESEIDQKEEEVGDLEDELATLRAEYDNAVTELFEEIEE